MKKTRIAIVGLGMAVTPHAKGLMDLKDKIEVIHAFSPSPGRRARWASARATNWLIFSHTSTQRSRLADCARRTMLAASPLTSSG